jgi:large repetitive protein
LLLLRKTVQAGFSFFLLIAVCFTTAAQTSGPQSASVNQQGFIRLQHTHHPLATQSNAIGRVEANHVLKRMLLVLSASGAQEAELKQLLDDQQNRTSSNYHSWLSPPEFGARFAPADAGLQRVLAWLQASGFSVERVATSKRWVVFSGTSSQVENAFQTVMQYYRVNGKAYLANATDIAVPTEFSGITGGVLSLNNFGKKPPILEMPGKAGRNAQGGKTKVLPNLTETGATTTYYTAPGDFASIYNTKALLAGEIDGTGVSIAVTAQSQIELTDVQQFRQIFGLKDNDPNFLLSGPDPGVASEPDSEEALLDVEWAGAVAPGATINLVVAGTTDTTAGVDLAAAYAIDNEIASIITYTYGSCEQALGSSGNAFYKALWQQAAAEGITVLVASGDNGAAGCDNPIAGTPAVNGPAVNGVASTPYNIAVGGTQFAEGSQPTTYWSATNSASFSSAIGYIPEAAWNESCDPSQPSSSTNCILGNGNFTLLASGGGASTVYPKPDWQSGPGVPTDNARDLPDVSLAAATGHDEAVYCNSLEGSPCQINAQQDVVGLTLVGGTSVSTPAMAGILALIEQKNGALQGQVNYLFYRLAQTQGNSCNSSLQTNPTAQNTCVFYDITSGNNEVPCAGASPGCSSTQSGPDGFTTAQVAGPGYDLVTGLGSVNAANLAAAWNSSSLAASQTTLLSSSTSFVHGTPVTLNGNVAAETGTGSPTGAVSIKTDLYGDSQQTLALSSGSYSGSVSDLPGGQYFARAYYAGNATFAPSESAALALNVTPENSTTSITMNGLQNGTASYGVPLQLKVIAAGVSGQGVASGTVNIQDGANPVEVSNLASDGTAYLLTGGGATYAFAPGQHSVTASYSGDNSFNASTSAASTFTIVKGTPFVIVGINTSTLTVGQTLGVHADVIGQGTVPATGTIQFTVDGSAVSTPVALQNGGFFGTLPQASILIANLAQGTHAIGASYDGSMDPNYVSVASGDPNNEIHPLPAVIVGNSSGNQTTTTLVMNTPPASMGGTGIFTVMVSPSTATGTVTLWDAVGPRTAATPLGNGSTIIQFSWPQAGSTSLYALYSGDASNAGSASAPVSFTVQKGLPQVTLQAPATALSTGQVSLNATVTGNPTNPILPYPVGVVEFWDSLNGGAAQLLTVQTLTSGPGGTSVYGTRLTLAAGTHSLYVHYRGDTNWQAANSPIAQVAAATFSISVSPNPLAFAAGSTGSGTVTLTPSGGFNTTVALACASGGTFLPAGYTCAFGQANVPVNNATATTTISFTPSPTSTLGAVKTASVLGTTVGLWRVGFGASLLVLVMLRFASNIIKNTRNFLLAYGLFLFAATLVLGCGGGGRGGGGPYSTTTTIVSNNIHAAYGTPVTFTVTVKPSGAATPSGLVQLYDNGQTYGSGTKVSAGIATFLSTSLPVGVHNLTAQYLGDANTLGSTSAPISQVISGSIGLQISGTANGVTETADFTVTVI